MAHKSREPESELEWEGDDRGEPSGPMPLDWALLVLRAAWRRKVLLFAGFVIAASAVVVYYETRRPMYRVDAKILTQRHQLLPSGMRNASDDPPARTAWELIHRRDNLVALARAAKLVGPPAPDSSAPPGTQPVAGNPEDALDEVVKALDRKLTVEAVEGTINLSIEWRDPEQAYRIVDGAIQNFVEARYVHEVTAIDEVISVLRAGAAKSKENLDRVIEAARRDAIQDYRATASGTVVARTRTPSEALVRLRSLLDSKGRAIEDVEEFRRRRLADLHAQLAEKRNTYSDAHPSVIQLRSDIDALAKDSSQVAALREEEAKLRHQYLAQMAQEGISDGGSLNPAPASAPQPVRPGAVVDDDERVREARYQYQQVIDRVNAAQLELDAVRAAFKYRYNVVWPPQVPTEPVSPKPAKILGAGFVAALGFAFLLAAAPDLRKGRILERWQVERGLGLPVLAELDRR